MYMFEGPGMDLVKAAAGERRAISKQTEGISHIIVGDLEKANGPITSQIAYSDHIITSKRPILNHVSKTIVIITPNDRECNIIAVPPNPGISPIPIPS
jgi:hypothetical protein